jgi:hypothetical protein
MQPPGYTCWAEVDPFTLEIQRSPDGLWTMNLYDRAGSFKVIMPPSEYDLPAAKEKALISAEYYMRKYGGNPSWTRPARAEWREFTPKSVIWET